MDSQRGNRGRARGRARSAVSEQQQPWLARGTPPARPAGAWGSGNPMRGPGPQPGETIRAAGPALVAPSGPVAWGSGQQRAAAPSAGLGRAQDPQAESRGGLPQQVSGAVTITGRVGGGGGDASTTCPGRGAMRGRRVLPEITIATKTGGTKQGKIGTKIVLQANYFRLEKRADWCVYQYRVDFAPAIDVTFQKKKLFYNGVAALNFKGIFDGTILYSPFRINPDPKEIVVDALNNVEEKVRITIRMVGELNRSSYQYLQVYNLIMRKCMSHLKLQLIKRDYFDPAAKTILASLNLELWPGVVTSIRQHESDVLMCAEIKHKIMKTETALDIYNKCKSRDSRDTRDSKIKYQERMLNSIVLTDYNNKTYNIDDVDFTRTPFDTFPKKDGETITFASYFQKRYGLVVKDQKQPLLVSKVKARELRGEGGGGSDSNAERTILLVPEFCRMTGLTEEERTNRQMKDQLEQYMMPTPQTRIKHLRDFNARLYNTPASIEEMKQFDLTLSKDILSINARKLDVQKLFYAPNTENWYSATEEADWTRNMRGKPMYRSALVGKWAILYSSRDSQNVKAFYDHMSKAAGGMRWNMGRPIVQQLPDQQRPGDRVTYMRTIEEILAKTPDLMFMMVVVPTNRAEHYGMIKKKLTVDKGIPSQLITAKTAGHKSAFSIATKVVVQINCKLGGAPWAIELPVKGIMVCGYDVCHDPQNKSNSYGALVASYDTKATAFYSTVASHQDGEELSNFIAMGMMKAVAYYLKVKKELPAKILFYRDGVGDGQIAFVYEHEMRAIYEQLNRIYASHNAKPAMRMIIVNKRINTRLFFNGQNPPPGTVVDDVITLPERSDFFLVSQCTRKGTVSPTYYSILGPDEFGIDCEKTQLLTHRFCHQYYNWGGTVRVPAACQYAHKLAFLAAQSLQRPPNESLSHLLHFL